MLKKFLSKSILIIITSDIRYVKYCLTLIKFIHSIWYILINFNKKTKIIRIPNESSFIIKKNKLALKQEIKIMTLFNNSTWNKSQII